MESKENKGRASLALWWVMVEAERELAGDPPFKDSDVILNYMGCGASHNVTAGDIREAIKL